MRIGTEDKKKLTIAAVVGTIGLGCAFYMYSELSVPNTPKPAAVPVPAVTTAPLPGAVKLTTGGPRGANPTVNPCQASKVEVQLIEERVPKN